MAVTAEARAAGDSAAGATPAPPSPEVQGAVATPDGAPRFMPGRYVKATNAAPGTGIARRLYDLSGGRINLGPSPAEVRHARFLGEAGTPAIDPPAHLAVASAEGGFGKSTRALLLASAV